MKFCEKYQDKASICFADKRATLVLKDKKEKREYRGNNPSRLLLTAYRVDGGLMKGEEMKCDYAVYTETDNLYFIELKGRGLFPCFGSIEQYDSIANTTGY